MSAFVDASALVAILSQEDDGEELLTRLEAVAAPVTSPVALFETALGIARKNRSTALVALEDLREFLEEAKIFVIAITSAEAELALSAFDRFGKGRHRAALNMGDCFAYACAKSHIVPLLCKGEDFVHTDIQLA